MDGRRKWFNDVFYPAVKQRTGRRVLLLLDNAPGHFDAFERDNIRIAFFPPNCTSWKQPCDMGIIAALKKRSKYLYLKEVLAFFELNEEAKLRKKDQGRRLRRGAAGVAYGNPAHLLDAASFVQEAWQSVSSVSIKNAFIKADIMKLDADEEVQNENEDFERDVAQSIAEMNLGIGQDELEEFVHVDDENSEEFATAVLEDVEQLLASINIAVDNLKDNLEDDNENDVPSQSPDAGSGNTVVLMDSILV